MLATGGVADAAPRYKTRSFEASFCTKPLCGRHFVYVQGKIKYNGKGLFGKGEITADFSGYGRVTVSKKGKLSHKGNFYKWGHAT